MNINIESAHRDEVEKEAKRHAAGGEVFKVGPGLSYVTTGKPVTTFQPMVTKFGWYVDTVYENQETGELGVIIMPLSAIQSEGDE